MNGHPEYCDGAQPMNSNYHSRWSDSGCVEHFAKKDRNSFFRSETYFLDRIGRSVETVLDVGCASGRFIELLRGYREAFQFTGIDISSASIDNARGLYPWAEFFEGDALAFSPSSQFDLVNATGVMQHEPRFEALIKRMTDWSCRYVLFDVKFAALSDHLVDQNLAYAGKEKRLYFIPLAPERFIKWLDTLEGIGQISIFGYPTPVNANVQLPKYVGQIVSAGVLLEKGSERRETQIALPDAMTTFK